MQTMDAWRTSCPRLAVWEEAIDRGLIIRDRDFGRAAMVKLSAAGLRVLETARRSPASSL
jgi:hypothetical protein